MTNGQTITRIDGSGSAYDDTQVQADLTQVEADIQALQTSKMDAFNVPTIVNSEQLLKFGNLRCLRQHPDNSILFTTSSSAITLRAPPDSNKQDNLTVTSPLTLVGSTMDFNRNSTTNGIDLGSNVLHAGNIIASQVECNILSGQCVTNLQNTFATVAEVAAKEPAFVCTSDLQKTLNIQNTTVELGISSALENRIAAAETDASNAEPAFQTTSDLVKTLNLQTATIELGLSSAFLASLNQFHCAGAVEYDTNTSSFNILADKGRYSFTLTYVSAGLYDITFATAHPDSAFVVNISTQHNDHFFRRYQSSGNGFNSAGFRIYIRTRTNVAIDVPFCFSVLA